MESKGHDKLLEALTPSRAHHPLALYEDEEENTGVRRRILDNFKDDGGTDDEEEAVEADEDEEEEDDYEEEEEVEVDVEEEEVEEGEEEEYEALMALTDARDLKARLTVDVISNLQIDNLVSVFIKCAEFETWPAKLVLYAFLVRFDVHPPRTGVAKNDLVNLVEEVLGNNS
jgi:hypothetical protein